MGLVASQAVVWRGDCWEELVRERSRLSEVLPLEGEHALVVVEQEHMGTGCLLNPGPVVVVVVVVVVVMDDNIHPRDHELRSTLKS